MAKLYITGFRYAAHDETTAKLAAPKAPPVFDEVLQITDEGAVSSPFPEHCTFVMLKATEDCCLAFGKDPEPDQHFHFVEAGERLFYGVWPGDKLAVITPGED